MIVLTLTNSPPKLTGDLTKWLIEIDIGVYVGNVNARVRDALWKRVCQNIGNGKAVLVFSTNNEQKMGFYTYNSDRTLVDYDGLTLVKKPLPKKLVPITKSSKRNVNTTKQTESERKLENDDILEFPESYVLLDFETTGLYSSRDEIIEIGLIKIVNRRVCDKYRCFVKIDSSIPKFITDLTGITDEMLHNEGLSLEDALLSCIHFIDNFDVISYNSKFEKSFMKAACKKCSIRNVVTNFIDARTIIKNKLPELDSYKLIDVARLLEITSKQNHRALDDCELLYSVLLKLNEND